MQYNIVTVSFIDLRHIVPNPFNTMMNAEKISCKSPSFPLTNTYYVRAHTHSLRQLSYDTRTDVYMQANLILLATGILYSYIQYILLLYLYTCVCIYIYTVKIICLCRAIGDSSITENVHSSPPPPQQYNIYIYTYQMHTIAVIYLLYTRIIAVYATAVPRSPPVRKLSSSLPDIRGRKKERKKSVD